MHLKRLDIIGFKSFSDHVKLELEPGITAIVGPNGCGKSNIIDAIRWCLGEMSAKSLRSNLMMDVVFNGSGARPAQNMAEVTLTFDNTDKRLPIDYSEVSVSRRLFRSGESEYFINKTQCRLKDVRELFLDTGMGEDGYSSIEQGKVEWLLQAKPEERRELFEEAAGVSKYRARREEALRKLERVELDLSRLNDITSVTQDQIRKLENAVHRAKTYERLRQELKTMEIEEWLFQSGQGHQDLALLKKQLLDAQTKLEEQNTKNHQLAAEVSELRLALTQNEEELLEANSQLARLDANLKIAEERLASAKQRQEELEKQHVSVKAALKRDQARHETLNQQKKDQTKALETLKSEGEVTEVEFVSSQEIFDTSRERLELKKKEVKEARDLILDRAQERARIHQRMTNLTSEASRLETQTGNVEKEKERVAQQIKDEAQNSANLNALKIQLETQRTAQKTKLETLSQQTSDHETQKTNLQKNLFDLTESMATLKGQIQSLKEEEGGDPYLAGAKALLAHFPGQLSGPLGRLFQCTDHDRDVVSAAMGEHLGDLVAQTTEQAEQALRYLKETGKGRARIWILESLPAFSESKPLAEWSNREPFLNRLQCEPQFRSLLVYLFSSLWIKEATIYGQAIVNGGVDPARWKSHLSHRVPELEITLLEREKQKQALEDQLNTIQKNHSQALTQREEILKEMENVRARLQFLEDERTKASQKSHLLQEEGQVLEIELAQLREDKIKAQYSLDECRNRFHVLQEQEKDDHAQLDLLQQELTGLQIENANANANLANKLERHKAFQEKLNWQNAVIDRIHQEMTALDNSVAHHEKTLCDLDSDIKNTLITQESSQAFISSSLIERQNASQACAAVQEKRLHVTDQIKSKEGGLQTLKTEQSETQTLTQELRIKEATLQNHIDTLRQKLLDQYELTEEQARSQFTPQAADPETLDKLKKRVATMGAINLAAPQEHAELMEKNNFLIAQQTDLLKAKEDLKQVISKINATTREHFKETFEKVRGNFRTLYGRLFQGGEADLRFTNEADILSTGIDIFCQPPGKKLLHISLLSGGEKALTAIALLFSFFQVRPSPIALLDEVDAPLDEANVLRYVEMLKAFSEKSQFFLITHNKRTMEAANVLYGVTMEELGVSKVISARLQKEKTSSVEPVSATVSA